MSTLKEVAESKVTLQIKPKEGLLLSVARDLVTFSFLLLCIYISYGSNWWTFVTGVMFLAFGGGKLLAACGKHSTTFEKPDDAIKYLEKWKADNA